MLADPKAITSFVTRQLFRSVRKGAPAERMKALELLGKSVGMFDPRRQQPNQHLHLHGVSDVKREAMARRALGGDA